MSDRCPIVRDRVRRIRTRDARIVVLLVVLVSLALPAVPVLSAGGENPKTNEACVVDRRYTAKRVSEVDGVARAVAALLPTSDRSREGRVQAGQIAAAADNLIDREVFATLAVRGVQPAVDATDEEFCRRVSLDLTGALPAPSRIVAYLSSTDPNKKAALVEELLTSPAYVDRWTNWWGDLLRNTVQGGDEYLENRNSEYRFLREAVAANVSAARIVTDTIRFTGRYDAGPSSFLPLASYQVELRQDQLDEMAAETSRAFLGTSIACISCHDGAGHLESINLYLSGKKRKEFWGVAAFFAQTRFEPIEFEDRGRAFNILREPGGSYAASTGVEGMRPPRRAGIIKPSFKLFAKGKPKGTEEPRVALARNVTAHPQFARNIVNRMWAHFFTIGLVEPLDGFDLARLDPAVQLPAGWQLQPSHPKLLTDLGAWFQANDFDVRALMRLVVLSRTYGLSSRYDESTWREEYVRLYARKLPRRLMAEETLDAIAAATRIPGGYRALGIDETILSTMALPGPTEPNWRANNLPDDSVNSPGPVREFLDAFGQGDRWVVDRSSRSSIGQALTLFNGWAVYGRVFSDEGIAAQVGAQLEARDITAAQAIETLYLESLSRRPTAAELALLTPRIDDRQSLADLQWALVNRVDFLYNY